MRKPHRILVADDEPISRSVMARHLSLSGFETLTAIDGLEAMERMDESIQVALFDLRMPGMGGMECLKNVKARYPDCQVIIVSGFGDVADAVQAMKEGAFDYISKPIRREELIARVGNALRDVLLARENFLLRDRLECKRSTTHWVAESQITRSVLKRVTKVAQQDAPVLITGGSGSGKSTIARQIHDEGPRSQGPFMTINCATLPRDLIESELFGQQLDGRESRIDRPGAIEFAEGGTIFLDEIGDLPLSAQPQLLTFLENRMFQRVGGTEPIAADVRLIAATHADLPTRCQEKRFREDLYYRLNVHSIHMPALSDRVEDLPGLAEQILGRIAGRQSREPLTLSATAMTRLRQQSWTGNIRELENVLERAATLCESLEIQADDLEFEDQTRASCESLAGLTLAELESIAIRDTLTANGGNKSLAARQLGISEKSIYNKMKRHGMR